MCCNWFVDASGLVIPAMVQIHERFMVTESVRLEKQKTIILWSEFLINSLPAKLVYLNLPLCQQGYIIL